MPDTTGPADRHARPLRAWPLVTLEVDAVEADPGALIEGAIPAGEIRRRADDAIGDTHRHLELVHEVGVVDLRHLVPLVLARALDIIIDLVQHAHAGVLKLPDELEPADATGHLNHHDLIGEQI